MRRILRYLAKPIAGAALGRLLNRSKARTAAERAAEAPGRATWPAQLLGAVLLGASALMPDMPVEAVRETLLWVGGLIFGAATYTRTSAEAQISGELVRAEAQRETARRLSDAARAETRVNTVAANIGGIAPQRRDGR